MRLGCCGSIQNAAVLKAAGFEFLEIHVQNVLKGDETDAAWTAIAPDPDKVPLPIEAANSLVPPHHPIVGPARDLPALQNYLQRVIQRAQYMGIKRLVFGSGAARKRPDDVDPQTTWSHLLEFTRMAGDICARHDIILVIEHLHRAETNTINSLADALTLCEQADLPSVKMLVDSFHYGLEREVGDAIVDIGDEMMHVHVAEVQARCQPGRMPEGADPASAFDFEDFFCNLRKIGYDGRVSIECGWIGKLEDQAPIAAKFLRNAWDNVGHCAI